MSKDVYIFIEQRDGHLEKVGLELLGKGRELADALGQEVVAILLGHELAGKCDVLFRHGANRAIVIDKPELKEYLTEYYTDAVAYIIKKYDPEIALFGATSIGRDLAPRLAARIHTGLTADCTKLEIDEASKGLWMTRPAFGGNLMATIVCEDFRPQMATVRPGVMSVVDTDFPKDVIVEDFDFSGHVNQVKIKEIQKIESKKKDITEAKILVSGGRGVGSEAGFAELEKLAKILGAEVSASRAAVDSGWIEKSQQVGQTGKTVRPELYFALGISGAVQHLAGMEDSDFIIAINQDENAPIFGSADMGIVGDIYAIIPKLSEVLEKEIALTQELS